MITMELVAFAYENKFGFHNNKFWIYSDDFEVQVDTLLFGLFRYSVLTNNSCVIDHSQIKSLLGKYRSSFVVKKIDNSQIQIVNVSSKNANLNEVHEVLREIISYLRLKGCTPRKDVIPGSSVINSMQLARFKQIYNASRLRLLAIFVLLALVEFISSLEYKIESPFKYKSISFVAALILTVALSLASLKLFKRKEGILRDIFSEERVYGKAIWQMHGFRLLNIISFLYIFYILFQYIGVHLLAW